MRNYLSFGGKHPSYSGKNNSQYRHGYACKGQKHPLYKKLMDIKKRCYSKKSKSYQDYGGRGIGICDEWRNNPSLFVEWGLENGWEKSLHIDRINDNLGYSAGNCQFITQQENNAKKRRTYKNNTSGIRGVRLVKSGRYTAQINIQKKAYWLGTFNTAEQAASAISDFKKTRNMQ